MHTKTQLDSHLFKDKKSQMYHAKFKTAEGKTRTRSTGVATLAEAREVLQLSKLIDMEIAAKAKALNEESLTAIMAGRKVTCEGALAEWLIWRARSAAPNTLRTQEITLRQFFGKLSAYKWPVARLKFDHIDDFVNAPDASGVSNREARLSALRTFFDFITARAYYSGDPSRLVKVQRNNLSHVQKEEVPRVPFTKAEYHTLMSNSEGYMRSWIALSYWAGLRMVDCACLEWASLLPDHIIVHTRKTHSRVALPLNDPLLGGGVLRPTLFAMLETGKDQTYAFPEERAIILNPRLRARYSIYFSRLLETVGIEGKSFHCLRHAFATRLKKEGKTIEQIGELLGHAKGEGAVTAGYIHEG